MNNRRTPLFVLTLGYSRKSVRLLVFRSSSAIWPELHKKAFRRMGCARVVVLDKLREGGARPDIYDRSLNPSRAEDWRRLSLAKNTSFDRSLCCNAFITMMKASKLWDLDDSPSARYLPRKRTSFGEP